MGRLKTAVSAAVTTLGLMLTACSGDTTTSGSTNAASESSKQTESCANSDMDLMETELGLWLIGKKIPLKDSNNMYYVANGLNEFDPCADFSWVILRGVEGPVNGLAPAAFETSGDVVVFFHRDKLITKMNFLFSYEVTDIQINGNDISVTYEELAYPRIKEGPLETIHYTFTGDELKSHSEPKINISPMELDFTREPPPTDAISTPLGNKHTQPVAVTYNDDVLAEIPMGEKKILCNFYWQDGNGGAKHIFYCEDRNGATWPLVIDETVPAKDQKTDSNGKTNFATIDFSMPSSLNTTRVSSGNIEPEDTFPDESLIAIGPYFVDTRGDTVKISNNSTTVVLGNGKAEKTEEPLFKLDTSKYPKNLKPWRI